MNIKIEILYPLQFSMSNCAPNLSPYEQDMRGIRRRAAWAGGWRSVTAITSYNNTSPQTF